ncbi:hypothetical protein Mkiyose1665_24550 [Mycobacterium kiyosense]|uniref:Uncharacterized protein n=1 Tax=Mycobacterium kiyosense TaxID=2871094 RepID=A0A9P3UTP7_9MYCO|nr:hypothetical protein IWGMT90018_48940 [Mycobacterium kiyosense]BDE15964.1 hypothetical protein MKCMC460_48240 [Mycobacterium sp. 20KCMC460]GLB81798.1 hypothetical protein SRL2020028_10540 [Mycobacterium kiyosense]GLB90338.1 hypothetical protein SRL2020130_31550 [Mycobacterium kiyosense]GLB96073.1 hypothetical protein SRL2020226_28490 [Mycobacterium kiyosense]
MIIPGQGRRALLGGLVVAGAIPILAGAPTATADPENPSPTPSSEQQPAPSSEQQQPGAPGLPSLPNNPTTGRPQTGDLADKNCWVVDGVPRWNAPGTAPAPIGPGQTAMPCYYVYGLTPH